MAAATVVHLREDESHGIPAEALEPLRAKHHELYLLEHLGHAVVVVPPNRPVWKRFRTQVMDDRRSESALEEMVRACVVHPPRAEFDAILDRRPGLVETFGNALSELAGAGGKVEKKAL